MPKLNHQQPHTLTGLRRKQAGFTLYELLMVVAILVVLFGLSVPGVVSLQKTMRQTELDSKAETIYLAVQSRLSRMKASGNTECFQYYENVDLTEDHETFTMTATGVGRLKGLPSDISDPDAAEEDTICYFTSDTLNAEGSAAGLVMIDDLVDQNQLPGNWVIEYNPTSAIVYAVYYDEGRNGINCAADYDPDDHVGGATEEYDMLRTEANRLSSGAGTGYYGGGSAVSEEARSVLTPQLSVTNSEELTITACCSLPEKADAGKYPVFRIALTDEAGHTNVRYYVYHGTSTASDASEYMTAIQGCAASEASSLSYTPEIISRDDIVTLDSCGRCCLTLTLDDLSSEETRFNYLYGTGAGNTYTDAAGNRIVLDCGTELTITVTAFCAGCGNVTEGTVTKETHSLFADSSTQAEAMIECVRHLKNLDLSSGLTSEITSAVLVCDLNLSENTDSVSFEPIENTALTLFDGLYNGRCHKITGLASPGTAAELFASAGTDGDTAPIIRNLIINGTSVPDSSSSESTVETAEQN